MKRFELRSVFWFTYKCLLVVYMWFMGFIVWSLEKCYMSLAKHYYDDMYIHMRYIDMKPYNLENDLENFKND